MFSPSVVQRRIDSLRRKGYSLTYHTLDEVERMNSLLATVRFYDTDKAKLVQTRDLSSAEVAWITNERLLCKLDFRYWLSRYVWIRSDEDRVVRMSLWQSQEIFLDIVSEMEEKGFPIMMIILKARQLGLSRIISLILLHTVLFNPNINAIMASSTEAKTRLLFQMADFVLDRLPWWMYHEDLDKKARRESEFIEFHNGSGITLQDGAQTSGIARGTTVTCAHISELAEFEKVGIRDPGSLIDSSLLRAMHDSANTRLFLEGTAEGINNWWHEKWKSCKALFPIGKSRLRPLFLPWFVGGLYPKPIHLKIRPVPANYSTIMQPWALEHARMAEEYVRCTDYLSNRLGSNWEMPLEQLWFYECERETALREGNMRKFLQEMPANDDEAFQSTNYSVFPIEVVTSHRDRAHSSQLTGCYGLTGPQDHIPLIHQPSSLLIDTDKPPIDIKCDWGNSNPIPFTLTPIKFHGWSLESDAGGADRIYLWEEPQRDQVYGLGIDTSDGVKKDRSVIEIIRKGSMFGPARQVGELASNSLNALDLTPFALALGTYFTVPFEDIPKRQPRMAIECRGNGNQLQLRLQMLGWSNFHPWLDRHVDDRDFDSENFHKIGIFTDFNFRMGMIDMLVKMIRDNDIELCSKFIVEEMQSLEMDDMRQSARANYGGHDDRLMALGFILVSLYRFDRAFARRESAQLTNHNGRNLGRPTERKYPKWTPGLQNQPTILQG